MTIPEKKNLAASVRQRLLIFSQKKKVPFDLILTRYGIERLLYRLSRSIYADRFLLKGAMLFHVWTDFSYRPTRDVDLLGFGRAETTDLKDIFRAVCSLSVEPDGVIFLVDTIKAETIREEATYGGIRISLEAHLENARIWIQCDIGFGDAVTPGPEAITFPTLLDFPSPHLRSYPIHTVVAEKLEALVLLGETNSRMKDFYDLWFLSQKFEFAGKTLVDAIHATFSKRKTSVAETTPIALTDNFAMAKSVQWNAFLLRNKLAALDMVRVIRNIRQFIEPPLLQISGTFLKHWKVESGWYGKDE